MWISCYAYFDVILEENSNGVSDLAVKLDYGFYELLIRGWLVYSGMDTAGSHRSTGSASA